MSISSAIASIASMYELDHDYAVVIASTADAGHLTALAKVDGTILAWDGVYFDDGRTAAARPVLEYDFDTWDDSRWKLVARANAQLLGPDGALHDRLSPTYSPSDIAVSLLQSWGHPSADPIPPRDAAAGKVLAYVPVTDGAGIEAWLSSRS